MKKKLFTLLVCAFAVISANADSVSGTTWTIYGNGVEGHDSDLGTDGNGLQHVTVPSGITTIKFVGSFPNGWNGTWFNDNGSATSKSAITNIDLSEIILPTYNPNGSNPSWGFSNFQNTNLTITWPDNPDEGESPQISYLPQNTFKECGMQTLHIPGYIKRIFRDAIFESSSDRFLKTVIFDEYGHNELDEDGKPVFVSDVDMDIDEQGFQLIYGLADVYINTEGDIDAANNAFPLHNTWGHGDTKLAVANLHFPEDKAEEYVNMEHELDEETANNDALYHQWLVDHYSAAQIKTNGWFEFVNSGASSAKAWPAQFLMTYSHPTLHQLVPAGVKAYVVNSITPGEKTVTLTLKSVNVIPAGTGVILFGGANSKTSTGDPALSMVAVNYTGPKYSRESSVKNYLTATCSTNPNYSTSVAPYGIDHLSGQVYRDFVFGKFSNTDSGKKYYKKNGNYGTGTGRANGDWYGFFRVKAGSIKDINPGKAYLHLSLDEYPFADGGEIIMNLTEQRTGSLGDGEFYRTEYYADGDNLKYLSENELKAEGLWYLNETTPISWDANWGVRQLASDFTMAKFMGEIEDEDWMISLGISNVEAKETKSGDIYNLQGMKVTQPTKGIFIKNGKKYIVK